MGSRGTRMVSTQSDYTEPILLTCVDDLLKLAEENHCYDGDKLDIEKVISYVSSINQEEPLTLEYVQMDPATSGSLTFSDGTWTIKVNKNHNRRRQRFTIAHELAHYMMHRNKLQSFTDEVFFRKENKSDLEYKANEFASYLLMPEEKVRKAVKEGIKRLGLLAERFDVSSPAMRNRVQELGYRLKRNE